MPRTVTRARAKVSEDDPTLEIFVRSMCSMDDVNTGDTHALLDGYPYGATSDGTVVDLGGSRRVYGYQYCVAASRTPSLCPNLPKAIVVARVNCFRTYRTVCLSWLMFRKAALLIANGCSDIFTDQHVCCGCGKGMPNG